MNLALSIPKEYLDVQQKLEAHGFPTYFVGGCVRDLLRNQVPKDFDLTTLATPKEMEEVFQNLHSKQIGTAFGTVGVTTSLGIAEITTFRKDGTYKNHRKPEFVKFSKHLEDDLSRRDFTINAMAYHPQKGLIDLFGGMEDIQRKRIRSVGDPKERFEEDALRILRGIRFCAQCQYHIEEKTKIAMKEKKRGLRFISVERIGEEIDKILLLPKPSMAFYEMENTKVLDEIFPELVPTVGYCQMTPYHDKSLFDHILCVVDHVPSKLSLRYAALFHDIAKPQTLSIDEHGRGHFFGHDEIGAKQAQEILKHYRKSNLCISQTATFIKEHMKVHDIMKDPALRRQIRKVGEDLILDLYDLMIADRCCTTKDRDITFIVERKERIRTLIKEEGIIKTNTLAVSGKDIIHCGIPEGKEVGRILNLLVEEVTNDPTKNQRNILLKRIKEEINKNKGE